MNIDKSKIDLNAPAFGEGAQKMADILPAGNAIEQEPKEEPKVEEPKAPEAEPIEPKEEVVEEVSAEKPRVTYSRFENVSRARREAEAEAEKWRQRAVELESTIFERKSEAQTPNEPLELWLEMYGDSEASRRAFKLQQDQNEKIKAEAREEALRVVREERENEAARTSQNEKLIEDHLDSVSAIAGRDLSKKEQDAILDILDEYTPKDAEGNIAGALISPDKAWEIFELKEQAKGTPKKQARDSVAALTSPRSEGHPDGDRLEKDKSWNPLDWSFMNRIK